MEKDNISHVVTKSRAVAIGPQKTAINMLKENLNIKLIAQVTGLAKEEILKLKNKL